MGHVRSATFIQFDCLLTTAMTQTSYTSEAHGASSEVHRHLNTAPTLLRPDAYSLHSLQAPGPLSFFQDNYYAEYSLAQLITSPHSDCVIIPIRNALPSPTVEESTPATYISVDWSRLLVFESTPHIVHVPLKLILSCKSCYFYADSCANTHRSSD